MQIPNHARSLRARTYTYIIYIPPPQRKPRSDGPCSDRRASVFLRHAPQNPCRDLPQPSPDRRNLTRRVVFVPVCPRRDPLQPPAAKKKTPRGVKKIASRCIIRIKCIYLHPIRCFCRVDEFFGKSIEIFPSKNLVDKFFISTFAIRNGSYADVAQRPEQLICNQLAGGSNPSIGSETERRGEREGDQERQTGATDGSGEQERRRETATGNGSGGRRSRAGAANGNGEQAGSGDEVAFNMARVLSKRA